MNGETWTIIGACFAAVLITAGFFGAIIRTVNKVEDEGKRLYFGECSECGEHTHLDWNTDMCACCKFVKIESPEYLVKLEREMYADQTWRQG